MSLIVFTAKRVHILCTKFKGSPEVLQGFNIYSMKNYKFFNKTPKRPLQLVARGLRCFTKVILNVLLIILQNISCTFIVRIIRFYKDLIWNRWKIEKFVNEAPKRPNQWIARGLMCFTKMFLIVSLAKSVAIIHT